MAREVYPDVRCVACGADHRGHWEPGECGPEIHFGLFGKECGVS